jgi:hypothetical protein
MASDFDELVEKVVDSTMAIFAGSGVRPVTVRLICRLALDLPLTPAAINDFGVATDDHYRALRAVLDAVEPGGLRQLGEDLDRAMGNGPALTKLVQTYAPEYKALRFETSWDDLHR